MLVAISIPIFTSQLEKSREATDQSNIRAAYAEVVADALLDDQATNITRTVKLTQTQDDWQTSNVSIASSGSSGGTLTAANITGTPRKGGTATLTWVPTANNVEGHVTLTYSAAASTEGGN